VAYDVLDRKHEIIVAGGGLAGWAAAVTAARAGRKVLLVSRRPNLGWEITSALSADLEPGASPLAVGILDRLVARGAARGHVVCPPAVELLLDKVAEEAGVELLLYATPLAPAVADGRVCGLLVGSKSGQHTLRADLLVDATDTRLPSRLAGAPIRTRPDVPGRSTIVLNCAAGDVRDGLTLGDAGKAAHITLRRSVWPGEVRATYDLPTLSAVEAHLAAPDVLALVRDKVPALAAALVTTMSVEPMPLASPVVAEGGDAALEAKVGAGLLPAGIASDGSTPAALVALGESTGGRAAEVWEDAGDAAAGDVGAALPPPPHEQADVVVAGGGTAGAFAAIAAARQGADTVLIEPLGYLGGIGTGGGIHSYYHGVAGGVQDELDARVAELSPLFAGVHPVVGFHPDAKKVALVELACRAGVRLMLGTTVTGVTTEPVSDAAGRRAVAKAGEAARPAVRLTSLVAAGPEGACVVEARAFVDSTGDGDVAAMAGAPFAMGRQGDGLLHAFSQSAGHLADPPDAERQSRDVPPGVALRRFAILNFDAGYVDPDDVADLTRGRRLGLRRLCLERWTPEKRWTYIAPHLGLRQGRQIIGDYQLTLGDEIGGATFADTIAYAVSHYDNHAVDYENESDAGAAWAWLLGQWRTRMGCEVPYRCLLPRGVEGLLVACRALSVTQDAHYQLRMQRDMQRLGEAAGIAAALAARDNTTPRALDVRKVQAVLRGLGALRDADRPQAALPDKTTEQLVADLRSAASAPPAVWQLAFRGHDDALPALRRAAEAGEPAARFFASAALALARDAAAVPELIAAVRERRDEKPDAMRAAPRWLPAIVLLGRVGDKRAVPELAKVLDDREAPLSALIAAVRALGRIGDPSAEPAVRAVLTRDDLETERFLQFSSGNAAKATEDARWQVDLAAAEALKRMGRPDPTIAEPYLADDRAYVRRRARSVLEP